MKIQYNKNEVIAAARFILANKPSSKMPSQIPHTDRGYQPERGEVDEILQNIRGVATQNKGIFEATQKKQAAGETNVDPLLQKWVEVFGVGGYWIIAEIEGNAVNFSIAVSPWFGDYLGSEEEV
jgi:hypothetical protein